MTTDSEIKLRRVLRPGDLARLATLTDGTALPLTEEHLTRLVLADPALAHAAVIIAERGRELLGYVHVACEGADAYVVSGAVAPAERRAGLGTRLLRSALEHARARGARTLRISGYPSGYATPGIDEAADPGTAAFLRERGAHPTGRALAMERPLTATDATPPETPASRAPAAPAIAPCTPEELPGVLAVVRDQLSPDWARALHAHVVAGGPVLRILLAREGSETGGDPGDLLGVAAWGAVDADDERFGPIGVVPAGRGRGVGGALLDAALAAMARAGTRRAHLRWTGPGSPAHRMYLSRGFRPLTTTTLFSIQVPQAAPGRTGS